MRIINMKLQCHPYCNITGCMKLSQHTYRGFEQDCQVLLTQGWFRHFLSDWQRTHLGSIPAIDLVHCCLLIASVAKLPSQTFGQPVHCCQSHFTGPASHNTRYTFIEYSTSTVQYTFVRVGTSGRRCWRCYWFSAETQALHLRRNAWWQLCALDPLPGNHLGSDT